jgi:hypothetical protein
VRRTDAAVASRKAACLEACCGVRRRLGRAGKSGRRLAVDPGGLVATPDSRDSARGAAAPDPRAGADVLAWLDRDSRGHRWSGGPGPRWPLWVRARVRLHRFSLDERLARGADPCSSLELARRAAELCQPKLRRELSADLERAVDAASIPARWPTAAVPVSPRAIAECRPLLLELAERLRCPGPVYARGVALVCLLLRDGGSPLYAPSEPRQLEGPVRRARAALLRG